MDELSVLFLTLFLGLASSPNGSLGEPPMPGKWDTHCCDLRTPSLWLIALVPETFRVAIK